METSRRPPFKGLRTVLLLSMSMALRKWSIASRTNGPQQVISTIHISDADIHHPPFFQFQKLYRVICAIQAVSGWVWSDDTGASITLHSTSSWDDYVKSHPEAKPFRNKGWQCFTKVSLIMPRECHGFTNPCGLVLRVTAGAGTGCEFATLTQPVPATRVDGSCGICRSV